MAKKYFGTAAFEGLNVKRGSTHIGDHELQESVNGYTDKDGEWSVAKRPEKLYSGSDIIAFESGRMGGADHHVWLDGTTLYDNGVSKGTVTGAADPMDIKAIDDQFLIMGGTKNNIYDGNHVREQGSWQVAVTSDTGLYQRTATNYAISAATKASSCVVTIGAHAFVVGSTAYFAGVVGMVELNGNNYTVTAFDGTTITLDCNSTDFTTFSATGSPLAHLNASGISGAYKFYLVGTIELSDGTILTGKPLALGDTDEVSGVDFSSTEPKTYTLSVTDVITFAGFAQWINASVAEFEITGTIGTDYHPGCRLYRTKDAGYDVYLEKTWRHGDTDFPYTAAATAYYTFTPDYAVQKRDNELGAVLDYGFNDHTNPPQSDMVAFAGQRTFVANAKHLHWSTFDGPEYYSDAGNTLMWDTITAIESYRDFCIVFSADRMWAVRIIEGVPDIEEIDTAVGTTYPRAVRQTSMGLMFLRTDGLWLFSGGVVDKISRQAFVDILAPKSVVQSGDLLYVSGSEKAYVAINRGDSWIWHESAHNLPYASATSGTLYGASAFEVSQMFNGSRTSGRLKTKKWGGFDMSRIVKLEMDFSGDTIPSVMVNSNLISGTKWKYDDTPYSHPDRRIVWTYLKRLLSNYIEVEAEVSGDGIVYGIRGSQER